MLCLELSRRRALDVHTNKLWTDRGRHGEYKLDVIDVGRRTGELGKGHRGEDERWRGKRVEIAREGRNAITGMNRGRSRRLLGLTI